VPYFSNIRREMKRPGIARTVRITPTPRLNSSEEESELPWNMRIKKRFRRQPNGVLQKLERLQLRDSVGAIEEPGEMPTRPVSLAGCC